MIAFRPFRRVARALEFGRHMPLAKFAGRLKLDLRRRFRDRFGTISGGVPPRLPRAATAPVPLFFPRTGRLTPGSSGELVFTFLNRPIAMPEPLVDWSAPGPCLAKQLWRMNLHYMEYLEALDDAALAALIHQWIDANPQHRPGAWRDSWNSYALSLRVVVWMQELGRRAGRLDPETVRRIERSLAEQLFFLEHNLETDIGGNHLIKNIKALIWASAFFAGPTAARWRAMGVALLSAEVSRQILPDGMHDERSPSYHGQVFADLLECRHALLCDPIGGCLDEALHRMAQVTADLTHPDGKVALFNDSGCNMSYRSGECLDVHEGLFGTRPAPQRMFALHEAGYFGLRSDETYFVADCGRISPDDLPAHGHGDVLSFEWSVAGARLIVDQGVFEYISGARRQACRSAANHNTLCLDGADQADFFGSFRCGRRPNVTVRAFEAKPDGFMLVGAHDGFRHLPGAPVHVRCFEVSPRKIVIRDSLEGRPDRSASLTFLLAPGVSVYRDSNCAVLRHSRTTVRMMSSVPIAIEDAVWWPDMGREEPTRRVRIRLALGVQEAMTTFEVV